jgi:predicted permease
LITFVAALAAGLLPALHAAGTDLVSSLKNDGTAFGRRMSQSRLRNLLVISQVAVCLMLLSCAGLLARNLVALRQADLGFTPQKVFTVNLTPRTAQTDRRVAFMQAVDTLRTFPNVAAVCAASRAPLLGGSGVTAPIKTTGVSANEAAEQDLRFSYISAGFFETFQIPLIRGRGFTSHEVESSARMIVISESAARRLWPGEEAIGKTLAISESAFAGARRPAAIEAFRDCEVVGVARDVTYRVGDDDHHLLYLPLSPEIAMIAPVFIRTAMVSSTTQADLTRAADAAGFTLQFNRRLSDYVDEGLLPFFGLAVLSGALGGLALLMASVGLYGVMAFAVNQRVREIGIRLALGATAEKIIGLFVRQGMRIVAIGIVLGLGGGALFALLLSKILSGLGGALDTLAFGAVTLIFAMVALAACWLPARRAAKVDPMVALRAE